MCMRQIDSRDRTADAGILIHVLYEYSAHTYGDHRTNVYVTWTWRKATLGWWEPLLLATFHCTLNQKLPLCSWVASVSSPQNTSLLDAQLCSPQRIITTPPCVRVLWLDSVPMPLSHVSIATLSQGVPWIPPAAVKCECHAASSISNS